MMLAAITSDHKQISRTIYQLFLLFFLRPILLYIIVHVRTA